ncbi:hypothetical protein DC522_05935 [Microvirga sp. KLBC 81]|uniref:hypothetical protein n=1 Tax=Microvirga sp. KLBC 81 TaxID=1862707 RepID=UPI000D5254A1|nr:hypothetical protein [Microvirga sp. KLBC 81]PVE25433.1 hypothetical protein DC522_05935 [Microvirga sp. KLBC 81]
MGDPVSAGLMTAASAGLKVAGGIGAGQSAKMEGKIKAIRYKTAAEAGRVRAIQTDAAYRDELSTTLANIDAITAGQNRGVDSATSRALASKAEQINSRARQVATSNEIIKAISSDTDAAMALYAGKQAMNASMLGVIPDALSAAQGLYKAGQGLG